MEATERIQTGDRAGPDHPCDHRFRAATEMSMVPGDSSSALLTDLYELTMAAAYFDHGMTE